MRSIAGFNHSAVQGSFENRALNKLGGAIDQASTGYSNDIQYNESVGGTVYGLPQQVYDMNAANGSSYLNQFKCLLYLSDAEGGGKIWTIQIVSGSIIYEDEHQSYQVPLTDVFSGSPVTIVDGSDPSSPFTNNGGYCVLDAEKDWAVYIIQIRSNDSVKFKNYLYVADTESFKYPEGGFLATKADELPPGIDAPTTAYTMQVIEVAYFAYDAETHQFESNQEIVGTQTIPSVERPLQFQVEVINTNIDIATDPIWGLRVAKGIVMSSPETPTDCIGVEWVNEIDSRCTPAPEAGDYADSSYTNNGGFCIVSNDTDYEVYLFSVTTTTAGVTSTVYVLWVGPSADFTDGCPVELPANIRPTGDYTAQAIHVASISQPKVADVWVVEQVIQGTITFPSYIVETCTPFKVTQVSKDAGTATYKVCEGTVNNIIPSNINDPIVVDGGADTYVWVASGVVSSAPYTYPDPANVTIGSGSVVPNDTDSASYIAIAHILTDGTVSPLVRGSVWTSRIKIGSDTALYYYAGI